MNDVATIETRWAHGKREVYLCERISASRTRGGEISYDRPPGMSGQPPYIDCFIFEAVRPERC